MEMNWIKCESGMMPEDDPKYLGRKAINVLVTTTSGNVTKVQRYIYSDSWHWGSRGTINGLPIAWMPLPEPYKEK